MNKFFDNQQIREFSNLELLANQVVEGFIIGLHKSPFHGFSVEFAEHRIYNQGESTKNIDWKVFARTDKLFSKKKKQTLDAISYWMHLHPCIFRQRKNKEIWIKCVFRF